MSYFSKSPFSNLVDCQSFIKEATYIIISLESDANYQSSDAFSVERCWLHAGFAHRPPIWLAQFDNVADICAAADAIQADHLHMTIWHQTSKEYNQLPNPSYYYLADLCVMSDGLVDLLREHRSGTCPAGDVRIQDHLQIRDRWYLRAAFGIGTHHQKARAAAPRLEL